MLSEGAFGGLGAAFRLALLRDGLINAGLERVPRFGLAGRLGGRRVHRRRVVGLWGGFDRRGRWRRADGSGRLVAELDFDVVRYRRNSYISHAIVA